MSSIKQDNKFCCNRKNKMNSEKLAGCLIIENRRVLLVKEKKDWYWKIPGDQIEDEEAKIVNGKPHPNEEDIEVRWSSIENLDLDNTTPSNKLIYNDLVK